MHARDLLTTALDDAGIRFLLALPPPETNLLKVDSPHLAFDLQNHVFKLWNDLLAENPIPPLDATHIRSDAERNQCLERCAIRGRLFLSIAGYFDYLFRSLLAQDQLFNRPLPDCFVTHSLKRFCRDVPDPDVHFPKAEKKSLLLEVNQVLRLKVVSMNYFTARLSLYFRKRLSNTPVDLSNFQPLEAEYHQSVQALHDQVLNSHATPTEIDAIQRLLAGVLAHATEVHKESATWQTEHRPVLFSTIMLDQFAALACRHDALVRRYGAKRIERIFERQLFLVMQSFGLYVIPAEIGESAIDLICISGDSSDRFSFLIEAKTSKAPYSLPKKDSRAIRDYVNGVQSSLSSFPPLSFVLLVGQSGMKRLADRVHALETECGVPVRFLNAEFLAELREQLPGVLPFKAFRTHIVTAPPLISRDIVRAIVEIRNVEQQAHQSFVKMMLSVHRLSAATKRKAIPT